MSKTARAKRTNYVNGELYGYRINCPGCGHAHVLPVGDAVDNLKRDRWTFNGNLELPTFQPSLLCRNELWTPPVTAENLEEWKRNPWPQTKVPHVCHSFITDGRIQYLDDCTHHLRGQTVDLPPASPMIVDGEEDEE